jgi:hypothetical protein
MKPIVTIVYAFFRKISSLIALFSEIVADGPVYRGGLQFYGPCLKNPRAHPSSTGGIRGILIKKQVRGYPDLLGRS